MVLIPGWGTKILHTSQVQQKKKKRRRRRRSKPEADILAMDAEGKFCLLVHKTNKDLSQREKKICVTSNKKPEGEIKEIIPFIIVSKRIKCLGKILPTETKNHNEENCKTLMKEIKDDMNRYTVFLDCRNQYCENDYTTQSNIQIQCKPCQITHSIFHRTGTKIFTICLETQKTPNSQSNLEKEKPSWRNQPS